MFDLSHPQLACVDNLLVPEPGSTRLGELRLNLELCCSLEVAATVHGRAQENERKMGLRPPSHRSSGSDRLLGWHSA